MTDHHDPKANTDIIRLQVFPLAPDGPYLPPRQVRKLKRAITKLVFGAAPCGIPPGYAWVAEYVPRTGGGFRLTLKKLAQPPAAPLLSAEGTTK